VIIDQGRKPVTQAIPDVPDKRTMVEELAVLGEELVSEPGFQGLAGVVG